MLARDALCAADIHFEGCHSLVTRCKEEIMPKLAPTPPPGPVKVWGWLSCDFGDGVWRELEKNRELFEGIEGLNSH